MTPESQAEGQIALQPTKPTVQFAATHVARKLTPLFRTDALSARADQWLGVTRAVQPWPLRIVAPAAVVIALAVVAFLVFGQYTARVRVQGVLVPSLGLIKLSAPQAARVLSLTVADGDEVTKGQVLYTLDLERHTTAGAASETVVVALKTQRDELKNELLRRTVFDRERQTTLRTKLVDLGREAAQVDRQIEASRNYAATLDGELSNSEDYLKRGIVVQRDVADRRSRLMTERTQLEQLRRERVQLDSSSHETQADIEQIDREGASKLSEIRRQVADLDRSLAEAEAEREIQIVAPEAGRVTGVVARAGQAVPNAAPLLTIVPASGELQAHLYAASDAIGFVREGANVMLRYAAFPYQKFGQHPGEVAAISRAALKPDEIEAGVPLPGGQAARDALYRLTVKPRRNTVEAYGKPEPLQVGMQVEADVFLDSRPIWQWILNPLFSLRTLHGGPEEDK